MMVASAPRPYPSPTNPAAVPLFVLCHELNRGAKPRRLVASSRVAPRRIGERENYRGRKYRRTITVKFAGKLEEPCGNRVKLQGMILGEAAWHLYSRFAGRSVPVRGSSRGVYPGEVALGKFGRRVELGWIRGLTRFLVRCHVSACKRGTKRFE